MSDLFLLEIKVVILSIINYYNVIRKNMKKEYDKPVTEVTRLQMKHYLLTASEPQGINATVSGYEEDDENNTGFWQN